MFDAFIFYIVIFGVPLLFGVLFILNLIRFLLKPKGGQERKEIFPWMLATGIVFAILVTIIGILAALLMYGISRM